MHLKKCEHWRPGWQEIQMSQITMVVGGSSSGSGSGSGRLDPQ